MVIAPLINFHFPCVDFAIRLVWLIRFILHANADNSVGKFFQTFFLKAIDKAKKGCYNNRKLAVMQLIRTISYALVKRRNDYVKAKFYQRTRSATEQSNG